MSTIDVQMKLVAVVKFVQKFVKRSRKVDVIEIAKIS